ncbi:coatomer epsilon subunit-domain-containing protein [Catenaria anguillulae PL171]|uniref:Coatomer epsilon subunit-domain-containing protein n=1 Tax=Catenaria anguillulae PL171 TaxID=765915 RepID=A0A1Y2HGM6_9FUNG|nr:coatomer epsilon subunit-domain-containing protein [Catenaria anguillulae PL171]
MASENLHARALFAVGHHAKLHQLVQSNPSDVDLAYLYRRALIAQGHAYLTTGAAAAAAAEGQSPGYRAFAQLLADPVKAANPRARIVAGEFYLAVGANELPTLPWRNLLSLTTTSTPALNNPNDAIVPQVLEARVHMAVGGAKIQDALWAWEELVQTYAASAYLLTMMGTCHLLQNNWPEAARLFGEAGQLGEGVPPEAQVNMVVASAAAGRADINTLSAMWTHFPKHPFTENLAAKAAAFDLAAAKYASA